MVRLKVACETIATEYPAWFQFQNGAIKSWKNPISLTGKTLFQFQNGAIKSLKDAQIQYSEQCFNSKMVRLKEIMCFNFLILP